jgi:hypothetical protein
VGQRDAGDGIVIDRFFEGFRMASGSNVGPVGSCSAAMVAFTAKKIGTKATVGEEENAEVEGCSSDGVFMMSASGVGVNSRTDIAINGWICAEISPIIVATHAVYTRS